MSVVVTGLNHRTSPLALREKVAFSPEETPRALRELRGRFAEAGVVILTTCNRVEVYVHAGGIAPDDVAGTVRRFLSEWRQVDEGTLAESLYTHVDAEAARHLFRVASSIDSLVVGEPQILGQVRDAYNSAKSAGTSDKVIHALFQRAFSVAKTIRSKTTLGTGEASIGSVAVRLAQSIFQDLSGKTALVVGSGEMGKLTLKHLLSAGIGSILVVNRGHDRARDLAAEFGGDALPWEEMPDNLHRADIVVTSTAAREPVLLEEHFKAALERRDNRPVFVIDIAVPRDVDPAVSELDDVYLYNIDDLERVLGDNIEARRQEAARAASLIDSKVRGFARWLLGLQAEPSIVGISEELEAVRARELAKTLDALPCLTEAQRAEVDDMSRRIVRSILSNPMTEVKQELVHHDPQTVLHLFRRFFGIERM